MPAISPRPRTRRASSRSNFGYGKPARHVGFPLQNKFPNFSPSPVARTLHYIFNPSPVLAYFARVIRTFASNRPAGSSASLVSRYCASLGASLSSVLR